MTTDCVFSYVKPLMECFSKRGISISLQSATNPNIPDALKIRTHRVGSVVLLDGLNLTSSENVIQVVQCFNNIFLNRCILVLHTFTFFFTFFTFLCTHLFGKFSPNYIYK